jgi:hypothetical protein
MSHESRYSKIFVKIWHSKDFRTLSEEGKMLFLYLLTSPHRNMGGFYYLPLPYLCFDVCLDEKRVIKAFEELTDKDMALYDYNTQVVLIKKWFCYNPIENENQAKGLNKQLAEIPKSKLFKPFVNCVKEYCKYIESILKGFDIPSENPSETLSKPYAKPGTETETETGTETGTDIKDPPPPAPVGDDKQHDEDCDEGHDEGAKPGSEPGSKSGSAEYSEDFLAFWNAYPRKREKRGAFRVWKARLREQVKPAALIAAAKNYAAAMKGKDAKFIKLPTTFLGPDRPYEEWVEGIPDEYKSKTKEAEKTTDYYEDVYLT